MTQQNKSREEKIAELTRRFGRKDLSFGCLERRHYRNNYDSNGNPQFDTTVMYVNKNDVIFIEEEGFVEPNMDFRCSEKEIIGHPLTLSDILAAIDCKTKLPKAFVLNKSKKLIIELEDFGIIWDLTKPRLDQQSDELVDSVFEILLNDEIK